MERNPEDHDALYNWALVLQVRWSASKYLEWHWMQSLVYMCVCELMSQGPWSQIYFIMIPALSIVEECTWRCGQGHFTTVDSVILCRKVQITQDQIWVLQERMLCWRKPARNTRLPPNYVPLYMRYTIWDYISRVNNLQCGLSPWYGASDAYIHFTYQLYSSAILPSGHLYLSFVYWAGGTTHHRYHVSC